MVWTKFWDMHSGGSQKLEWDLILIQAPLKEAEIVFYNRFSRNPYRVTCTCCGADYSASIEDTLEEALEFHRDRGYTWKIIPADKITAEDKQGSLPEEGYIWRGG